MSSIVTAVPCHHLHCPISKLDALYFLILSHVKGRNFLCHLSICARTYHTYTPPTAYALHIRRIRLVCST